MIILKLIIKCLALLTSLVSVYFVIQRDYQISSLGWNLTVALLWLDSLLIINR
jgi:hypothetical protein